MSNDKLPVRAHEVVAEVASAAHPGLGILAKILRPFTSQAAVERGLGEVQLLTWIDEAATAAVEANIDRLLAEGHKVTPDDVYAALKGVLQASERTIGADKRELLKRALVNAFDPELYKQGLAVRVFKALEAVEYQDVLVLRRLEARSTRMIRSQHDKSPDGCLVETLDDWLNSILPRSVETLIDGGLAFLSGNLSVYNPGENFIRITGFGRHFLAYLRE